MTIIIQEALGNYKERRQSLFEHHLANEQQLHIWCRVFPTALIRIKVRVILTMRFPRTHLRSIKSECSCIVTLT